MTSSVIKIRCATIDDVAAIEDLIERSVRGLQAGDYSADQMTGALGSVFGVDTQLIRDQTYFIAERNGRMVGCGGWSRRQTLFGSDAVAAKNDAALQPGIDAARIRAFFVEPACARQGIGTAIMQACQQAATDFGFTKLELVATLTGEALYQKHGFVAYERFATPLNNGLVLPVVRMRKSLMNLID